MELVLALGLPFQAADRKWGFAPVRITLPRGMCSGCLPCALSLLGGQWTASVAPVLHLNLPHSSLPPMAVGVGVGGRFETLLTCLERYTVRRKDKLRWVRMPVEIWQMGIANWSWERDFFGSHHSSLPYLHILGSLHPVLKAVSLVASCQ